MIEVNTIDEMVLLGRNALVSKLAAELGIQIRLSDEPDPVFEDADGTAEYPFGYYSVITPYASGGELGNHTQHVYFDSDVNRSRIQDIRAEYPELHLSFTFCSKNRKLSDGTQISGESEAMQLALRAAGWLKHGGAQCLQENGLAILRISGFAPRGGLFANETIRRWGFDVALRYKAETVRVDETIKAITIKPKKRSEPG